MKWFKLITGGLVVVLVALFMYQNLAAFKTPVGFKFDLYIREPLAWSLQAYTLMLAAAVIGFCLGILAMLKPYFNVRRLLSQERQGKQDQSSQQAAFDNPGGQQPGQPGSDTAEAP